MIIEKTIDVIEKRGLSFIVRLSPLISFMVIIFPFHVY